MSDTRDGGIDEIDKIIQCDRRRYLSRHVFRNEREKKAFIIHPLLSKKRTKAQIEYLKEGWY